MKYSAVMPKSGGRGCAEPLVNGASFVSSHGMKRLVRPSKHFAGGGVDIDDDRGLLGSALKITNKPCQIPPPCFSRSPGRLLYCDTAHKFRNEVSSRCKAVSVDARSEVFHALPPPFGQPFPVPSVNVDRPPRYPGTSRGRSRPQPVSEVSSPCPATSTLFFFRADPETRDPETRKKPMKLYPR